MRIGPMLAAALCLLAACARLPRQREARYMEQARQLVQKKDYTRAALLYRNAIQAMPGDAEPYYQLGLTYLAAGSHSQAIECFRKATEIDPKHAAAQLKLADLLARANDAATLSDAERRAQEIVTLFPDDVDALNTVALTELRLGRTEQAAAHLEQALNRLPGGLESSALLMRARLAQRDTQGAEEALQKCYRKAPQSAELALVMGRFYLVTQRPGPAEEQFRRAIRINPRYGAALLDLGITLFHLGRSDEAGRIFQQAAALPGKSYRPAYALFLLETGQRDAAIGELENLARQDPSDRAARTRLVKTYLAAGRRADADKALAAALAINPRDADALLQRGELSIDDGRYQDAQNDLNLVLRYRPETADPHIALARMYRGQGRTLNARQELAEALRLDSGRISVRLDLARLLIESKAARAALEVLGRAADSDKRTLAFIVESNWALLDLGRRDEARQGVAEGLRAARTPDLLLQDALLKIGDRNYTGARAALDAALAQNPEDVRALRALVKLYDARGQYAAGVAALREYVSRHGSSAPLQNYLGEVLLAGGQNGEARAAFAAAQSANPGFRPALLALVNLDVAGGRLEPAHR
ncbi:MAG TPA: tetratricopeptide repeat protein, partial [Bryobacteraceae bacterium]|nr:tetratricopeptide repeat protein [Bryobacteraceae bacterium]